jgi:hypothetical protein
VTGLQDSARDPYKKRMRSARESHGTPALGTQCPRRLSTAPAST